MKRGWVESKDIRKADSDEENMREAGWVEVIQIEEYEKAVDALRQVIGCNVPGRCRTCAGHAYGALRELGELAAHRDYKLEK